MPKTAPVLFAFLALATPALGEQAPDVARLKPAALVSAKEAARTRDASREFCHRVSYPPRRCAGVLDVLRDRKASTL